MSGYRTSWYICSVFAVCVGTSCALLTMPPQHVAGFGVDGVLVAITMATAYRATERARHQSTARNAAQLAGAAALGVPAGIAVAGLVNAVGLVALTVPVAALIASPWVIEVARSTREQVPTEAQTQDPDEPQSRTSNDLH